MPPAPRYEAMLLMLSLIADDAIYFRRHYYAMPASYADDTLMMMPLPLSAFARLMMMMPPLRRLYGFDAAIDYVIYGLLDCFSDAVYIIY